MMAEPVEVEAFDPRAGTEADWRAMNTLQNRVWAERWPDDPPRPLTVLTVYKDRDRLEATLP